MRGRHHVPVPPQAFQSNLIGTQQSTTINQTQQQPAILSNLPQYGTGLNPNTARRGRDRFKTALPLYEPATKELTEDTKTILLPGCKPFKERNTYPSLHDRRTKGSNLDVVIVTEFLISSKDSAISFQRGFEDRVSRRYNDEVPIEYPRMTRRWEKVFPGTVKKWNLFETDWLVFFPTNSERCEFAVPQTEVIRRVFCVGQLTSCVLYSSEGQTHLTASEHQYQCLYLR